METSGDILGEGNIEISTVLTNVTSAKKWTANSAEGNAH